MCLNKFNIYSYILRHCATRWKIAGSFPDGVIGTFQEHNPFVRNMTLELTQPVTEINKQVKWSRYRTGGAQKGGGGRGIALLFHDCGTRRGWVVSSTPRLHFTPGEDPVPILQDAGWALSPVWTGGKSRPYRDSIPDPPPRSQSLYRLSYPTHNRNEYHEYFLGGKGGRCVGLTTLPTSCADCLEIWKPPPPGTLRACSGLYRDCFTLHSYISQISCCVCWEINTGRCRMQLNISSHWNCYKVKGIGCIYEGINFLPFVLFFRISFAYCSRLFEAHFVSVSTDKCTWGLYEDFTDTLRNSSSPPLFTA